MSIDISHLRLGETPPNLPALVAERKAATTSKPRPKKGDAYLGGNVPWSWITSAGTLPGRALHVGLVIWHLATKRRSNRVKVNLQRLAADFDIDRSTASRALGRLATAGLVRVERRDGRCPMVTLLDAPTGQDAAVVPTHEVSQ